VVIDEVNTIPFFTPLWADVPQVMFIHQLAREVWWYESVFPLSAVGYVAEPLYLRLYRHLPVLTVSTSTKQDLCRLGFRSSVTIIPEGLEPIADIKTVKPAEPTFVYVGRMAPSKRIEHILAAFAMFREATGRGQLRLIGTGPSAYRGSLERLARRLRVDGHIEFSGRVSTADKHRLMAESHLLLMTSVREGWGLVVTEANACGTPAIVYDVPGLRDSVRNESTGLVVSPRPERLADAMIRLIYDHALYNRLAKEARIWSKTFSFDEAARLWAEALEKTLAA
jgi:glycosyltransferase involved in cell wall biosynthesis